MPLLGFSALTHSVLAKGSWFKIRISQNGIYKITYTELQKMGFPLDSNDADIALYGNGGGMLPEVNNAPRPEGLTENPIEVVDGGDGKMNPGDYILFYGKGPVVWSYNAATGHFTHQIDYYSDYAYYFLTLKSSPGKRIQIEKPPAGTPDLTVNTFTGHAYHELDEENLGGTGRIWYGEIYDFTTGYQFKFDFPNIVDTSKVYVNCSFASKSSAANSFSVYADGTLQKTLDMPLTTSIYDLGQAAGTSFEFLPDSSAVTIKTNYNRSDNGAIGYLDYIDVNAMRKLIFTGDQMPFTCVEKSGTLAQYNLTSGQQDTVVVWDVTDPLDAKAVSLSRSGNNYRFETAVAPLKSFIAFDDKGYLTPEFVEKVANQDLHYVHNIDYLIISAPEFLSQAERLAQYHEEKDHMTVYVTTPQKIYNEFSSGAQDITAIRDFVKRIYDQSDPGEKLKYLLLFGDASYDYKDRVTDNTNYVPCWESLNSLNTINSYASDDYYGFLQNGQGTGINDKVDIGIGRFPVDNLAEATTAVDKVISYATPSPKNMGPWRNVITLSADDGDYDLHLNDAQALSHLVEAQDPVYNQNKLYLDAFPQISTPGGQLAPAMNAAIDASINKGTLIFNYSGHGGVEGLGQERFLTFSDINSWTNYNKLTVFITATCDFTAFDNPKLVSAGERVFMSDKGGAIALFTTTRATYASSNLALNSAIYDHNIFQTVDGKYPRFGDVIRRAKVQGGENDQKFVLIGDPALRLAAPDYKARTTKINSKAFVGNEPDTLKALETIRIQGQVEDSSGNILSHYNGTLYPTVYDKQSVISTLGSDAESPVTTFKLWKNVLFNGKTDITNGKFDFSFVVPKDISYNYGPGRVSYYFTNDTTDGHGYSQNIVVGGYDQQAAQDTTGPKIRLFLNDTTFRSGNITDANPVLYALISDPSGINTTGDGIGHDIVATLDSNSAQSYDLNNYYVADIGNFTKGSLRYQLQNLSAGKHTLTLKVWDVYNNSSTATLSFTVDPAAQLVIKDLKNYPNPFSTGTNFIFDHNQAGKTLNLKINIYQLDGQKIKTIHKIILPSGFSSGPIYWNGDTDSGGKIGSGIYIYRLTVTSSGGKTRTLQSKMVFIR